MEIINHYPTRIEPLLLRITQLLKKYQQEDIEPILEVKKASCLKSTTSFPGEQSGKMPDWV